MSVELVSVIISSALAVTSVVVGEKYAKTKKLLKSVVNAIEDDSVTEEELSKIVETAKDVVGR